MSGREQNTRNAPAYRINRSSSYILPVTRVVLTDRTDSLPLKAVPLIEV
jgi:hypothetical protein